MPRLVNICLRVVFLLSLRTKEIWENFFKGEASWFVKMVSFYLFCFREVSLVSNTCHQISRSGNFCFFNSNYISCTPLILPVRNYLWYLLCLLTVPILIHLASFLVYLSLPTTDKAVAKSIYYYYHYHYFKASMETNSGLGYRSTLYTWTIFEQ